MVRRGKLLCPVCMRAGEQWVYHLENHNLTLQVLQNRMGHCIVVPWKAEEDEEEQEETEISVLKKPKFYRGLPLEIRVKVKTENWQEEVTLDQGNRICPHCLRERKKIQHLPLMTGYLDTYVVGLMGAPGVGKTSFFNAYAYLESLNDQIEIGGKIFEASSPKATSIGAREDLLKELVIRGKKEREDKVVLFMDTPGELFSDRAERAGDYQFHADRLAAADGLVLMVDDRMLYEKKQQCDEQMGGRNRRLLFQKLENNIPMAVLLNKADKLYEYSVYVGGLVKMGVPYLNRSYPGFSETELDPQVKMRLDRQIMRQLLPGLGQMVKKDRAYTGYFIASSGEEKQKTLDHAEAYGVQSPMMWLLRSMGAISERRGKE